MLAIPLSIFLSVVSGAIASKHTHWTPGMVIAHYVFSPRPAGAEQGLRVLGSALLLQVEVDAAVWFVIVLGVSAIVCAYSKRRSHH